MRSWGKKGTATLEELMARTDSCMTIDEDKCTGCGDCLERCPTGAISLAVKAKIDLGKCIWCKDCIQECDVNALSMEGECRASDRKENLISRQGDEAPGIRLKEEIRRTLGRSLTIRMVDAGSCNGCEVEINSMSNPYYDLERFGIKFVASPRHADALLVTGPVTRGMEEALIRTFKAAPEPKLVIAMGTCAISGGPFGGGYASGLGVDGVLPVDIYIPGCPPTPRAVLFALLDAMGRL